MTINGQRHTQRPTALPEQLHAVRPGAPARAVGRLAGFDLHARASQPSGEPIIYELVWTAYPAQRPSPKPKTSPRATCLACSPGWRTGPPASTPSEPSTPSGSAGPRHHPADRPDRRQVPQGDHPGPAQEVPRPRRLRHRALPRGGDRLRLHRLDQERPPQPLGQLAGKPTPATMSTQEADALTEQAHGQLRTVAIAVAVIGAKTT